MWLQGLQDQCRGAIAKLSQFLIKDRCIVIEDIFDIGSVGGVGQAQTGNCRPDMLGVGHIGEAPHPFRSDGDRFFHPVMGVQIVKRLSQIGMGNQIIGISPHGAPQRLYRLFRHVQFVITQAQIGIFGKGIIAAQLACPGQCFHGPFIVVLLHAPFQGFQMIRFLFQDFFIGGNSSIQSALAIMFFRVFDQFFQFSHRNSGIPCRVTRLAFLYRGAS